MKIQVLGSGCPSCKSLYELTQKSASELGITDEVEYITDITKIVELGVMTSPVLAIDGVPVLTGSTNDHEKVKELLRNAMDSGTRSDNNHAPTNSNGANSCSCGGNCPSSNDDSNNCWC